MDIKVGQKCRFIDPFGFETKGEVLSIRDNSFTVYEPLSCPAQYNDSFVDLTEEDIGKRVWFD